MRLLLVTLAAAAFAGVTAAQAQPSTASPTMADERCLLGMVLLSNTNDPNQQRLGSAGVAYFTGRIAAREPNFDFGRLKSLAASIDPQSVQTDLQQHCGPMFAKSMQQVGAALAPPASNSPPSARPAPPAPQRSR